MLAVDLNRLSWERFELSFDITVAALAAAQAM
jgi:hypothetical protein